MTSGKKGLKERESLQGYIEREEKEEFEKIRWREHLSESELVRIAVQEYIKVHKEGNTTYVLDDFASNKDMIAIPALMKNREDLSKYVKEEKSYEELEKVAEQCEFFAGIIKTKLLNTKIKSPEKLRIQKNKSERFINQNDIRYKDPKTLSGSLLTQYNHVMLLYTDEEREKFQKGWKKE